MGEGTSTPNGGSKKREGYSEAKVEKVSENKISNLLDKSFSINSMAIYWKDNVRIVGGEENTKPISSGELVFDKNVIIENSVVISVKNINERNGEKIKAIRKKKAEKAAGANKEAEDFNNRIDNRIDNQK